MWISWSFQTSHNISITEVSNGKHSTILIGRPWNIYPKLSVHDQANRPKLRVGIFISFTRVNKNHSKFNSSNPSESLLIIVPLRQDEIQTLAIQVQNIYPVHFSSLPPLPPTLDLILANASQLWILLHASSQGPYPILL